MMSIPGARRLIVVWAILIALTLGSFALGIGIHAVAVALLALAMIKAHLVAFEFMEARTAPLGLGLAIDGWALATFAALSTIFVTT